MWVAGGQEFLEVVQGTLIRPMHGLLPLRLANRRSQFPSVVERSQHRIDLLQGDPLQGIILVGEYGQRVDRHFDLGRLVAILFLEPVDFLSFHRAAHRA